MPKLSSDQQQVVAAINAEAQSVPRPLRHKFKLSAIETGIVEYGLHNRPGGTSDSSNWRQERKSVYGPAWAKTGGPLNLRASVRRYRDEFLQQYNPGETAGQVAAQVQRPAAQYRDRYQQARPQARQILAQYGGAGGMAGGYQTQTTPGVDNGSLRQQLKLQYLQNSHDPNALLQLASGLQNAQDTPSTTSRVRVGAASPHADGAVALMKAAAEKIDQAKVPYQWGGGHSGRQGRNSPVTALDCSGAVSRVLGIDPLVSGQLASWGKPGKGKRVSVFANGTHTLLELDGRVFATSAENPGGGAGWVPKSYFPKGYFKNFTVRHPPNM